MSNIRCSDLFKYKVKKNIDGSLEYPKVFLMSRSLKKRGIIAPIESLIITPKFKDSVECSFTVYKDNNGITLPLFERIKDNCIIMIEGYGLFQIKTSLHETDAVYKEVTGTTMQANELSQCYCKLQINTEDDIARKDYNKDYPTLFYRKDGHKEASLLHRILTYAPTYTIGHVDSSLWHINREFSCDNSTVYDFFQTVAEEVGCIFVFSRYKREINVFDLEDHCTNPECDGSRRVITGVCQKCKSSKYIEPGYGLDASTYLDTHNLLEEITDTIDADSIKNCFKLVAGDDTTTNLIGQRLIGNSPYIWTFSDFELEEFSDALREKWLAYQPYVDKFQKEFDSEWDIYNDCVNKKLYWKSGKMPAVENPTVDSSDPLQSCKNIFNEITSSITYTATSKKNTVETTIASQVLNYAKLLCPEGYEVSYQTDSNGKKMHSVAKDDNGEIISFTSYLYICLKNCKDDLDSSKDKYFYKSDAWTIPVKAGYNIIDENGLFTTDYFLFMKQQVEVAFAKADITYEPKYDTDYDDGIEKHLNDPDYYKNYFREYGISRLTSFKEAYDTCTVILLEQNASLTENSEDTDRKYIKLTGVQSAVSLYDELSGRYLAYSAYIEDIIAEYTKIYNEYESKRLAAKEKIDTINTQCNLKTYLGDDLYNELLTFKREDTYENKNFSSDVVDEATLMGNIEEFLIAAKNEIVKACQPKHEISVKMAQLLTISDYESVMDAFAVGNYVRTRINGELAKMRIISIPINFTDIEQSDVTFSDTLVGNQQLNNLQEQFQKAASLATSFSFVQKQSERNDSKINKFDEIISDGLDATKNMIMNSEDQEVIMDSHGLLARSYDANSNSYEPEQSRWNKDGIIFTDNNWDTIKTALGKIYVGGEWKYGLIADYIIGNMIAGKNLTITDGNHSVVIDQDGITLDGGAIKWKSKLPTSSIDGLDDSLQGFIKAVGDLQSQIDGEITIWFEDYDPTDKNEPTSTWTSEEDKVKHEGDLFYNTETGGAFRYIYNSSTKQHEWSVITDTAISRALENAKNAQDTADGKRRVFTVTPYVPYDEGDLWAQGSNGDLYRCIHTRTEKEKYTESDWEKATKYTDDTAWQNWISDSGDFGKYKSDMQSQLDGKSEATYGGSTPPSNPETGDLWFCTNGSAGYDANKAYMFDGTNWQESNGVPDSVWDIADGKSSIFVTKPSKTISSVDNNFYHKNDLWILESDDVLEGHTKGTVMVATADSTSFNTSHWTEKVKYTDDTKANAVEKSLTDYKKEIADFQKEVDTQLSVAGVTKIANDYVYSPKIASGYLYITKDGCSVQIDPSQSYDAQNDKVIDIKANQQNAFYIKRNGDAYFKGDIVANSLTLGSTVKINTNNISGLSSVATSGSYNDLSDNPDLTVYAKTEDVSNTYATKNLVNEQLKGYATTGALDSYLKTNDLNAKLDDLHVAYRGDVSTSQTVDATTGLITTTNKCTDLNGQSHTYTTYTYSDSDYVLLNRENQWGNGSVAGDGKNLVKISKDGLLTANNAVIYGTIYATDGEFTGKITATSGSFINGTKNVRIDDNGITLSSGQSIHWEKDAPVSTIKEEYLLSTSATTKPLQTDSNWSTTAPSWEDGKYMWKKTITTDTNGVQDITIVCLSGATGQKGDDGDSATTYYIQANTDIIVSNMFLKSSTSTIAQCFSPYQITVSLYKRVGNSATMTPYNGYIEILEESDSMSNRYFSSSAESSTTYTMVNKETTELTCCMYASDGKTKLDSMTIPVIMSDNIVKTMKQYNLSSSKTEANGIQWIDKQPTWSNGNYIWTRSYTKYESGYEIIQDVMYDDGLTQTLQDFTDFNTKVDTVLDNALPYTVVGDDYIIAPKIGGGYLDIANANYRIQINPNNTDGLFEISNKSGTKKIMGIDANGNGYISGQITASSGSIGGWNISKNGWLSTIAEMSAKNFVDTGISWTVNGNNSVKYTSSMNGVNIELDDSTSNKLKIRLNSYNDTTNSTSENCILGRVGYISLISDGQCIVSATDNLSLHGKNIEVNTDTENNGTFSVNATNFSVDAKGNLSNSGTLTVNGDTNLNGNTISNGILSVSKIGGTSDTSGRMLFDAFTSNTFQIYPEVDNRANLGLSGNKWYAMYSYAYNGASDRKLKTNIHDLDTDWSVSFINAMKPSSYQFKESSYGKTHTGFIAQDVERAMLDLGMKRTDFAGLVKTPKNNTDPENDLVDLDNFEGADENYEYSLRYDDFIAPLVSYCQYLYTKTKECEDKNQELENKLNKIYEKLGLSD